ncbi:MAG: PDZ domain-containing protein [Opitutaceae bacterium]|jgi:serine protease Do
MRRLALILAAAGLAAPARAGNLPALWAERAKCTVAVEYITETELERRPTIAYGTVVDAAGTVILPSAAIDLRISPKQIRDFKMYLPGDPEGYPAQYLGRDAFTGWHFVRASPLILGRLVPVTAFYGPGAPRQLNLADEVWGVGLRNKDEDFTPYILQSHVALIQALPQRTAIAQQEVAGPGLPVFDGEGRFVGLGASSFGQTFLEFSGAERGGAPIMLVNLEESSAFLVAEEVLPCIGRIPKNVFGRPLAWLGAYGLEPMDREVAAFLKLESQSGAVVSEVLEGSPAEKAGMKARDIILGVDGKPLPRFRPDRVVVDYVERLIAAHAPGDSMALSVLRGQSRVELKASLEEEPRLVREADRLFFEKIGFTAREFVYGDAVARHARATELGGVVAHLVKPNSPADIAGLRPDDWVKEVDGASIPDFPAAVARLSAIEKDPGRAETVFLVSRGSDTAVLRIKLR